MRLSRIPSFGLAALLCCAGSVTGQDQNGTPVFRIIPLPQFGRMQPDMPYPDFLQLHEVDDFDGGGSGPLLVREESRGLRTDQIADLIRRVVDPNDEATFQMDTLESALAVRGARAEIDRIAGLANRLRALGRPELRVEVSLLALGRGAEDSTPPTILEAEEVAGLKDKGQLLWNGSTSVTFDQVAQLGSLDRRLFVRDYEVEVAEDAGIGDPTMSVLLSGMMARVEFQPAVKSDEIVVFADLMYSRAAVGSGFYSLGTDQLGALDAPRNFETRGSVSGRIANGGALAIWSVGRSAHSPDFALIVQVERESAPAIDGLRVVPIGGLKSRRMFWTPSERPRLRTPLDRLEMDWGSDATNDAYDAIQFAQAALVDEADDYVWSLETDHFLFFDADSPQGEAMEQAVLGFEKLYHRNIQAEVVTRVRSVGGSAISGAAEEQIWDRLLVPGLANRVTAFRRGVEANEVADFEVEIAKKSVERNPRIVPVFSGVFGSFQLQPDAAGAYRADLVGDVLDAGSPRRRSLGDEAAGDLWIHDNRFAPMNWAGTVRFPKTIEFGDGFSFERDGVRYALRSSVTFR